MSARVPEADAGRSTAATTGAGTSTFLFTDIEGSTRLIQALGDRYLALLERHRELLAAAIEGAGGRIFGSEGDALFSAFATAGSAVAAGAAAQRALSAESWPEGIQLRVRMGIHSGEAVLTGGDYVGLALHQVARITSAGHGGQVLVSEATRRLLPSVPVGLELRDLGERRLKDLTSPERLYQLVGEGLPDGFPPLRTLDARANNLPVQLTSFVGREEFLAAQAALTGTRLLTLTGPGGTGKTRLALQLAAEASDDFRDGVFFVGLDSVDEPELVPSAIATALGLTASGATGPLEAVTELLREKQLLLVLDNFEQVVDAAPDVARLLREARDIKIIVTTRIALRVSGEQEFPVPPLGLPPESTQSLSAEEAAQHEAVRLFVERAMAVQPSFVMTDESAPLIVDIVRRLDGLPLAIELAAARTRVLPVAAIRARLDQHLSLLTGGARDLPARQQTLRGAIDWSYDLLEGPDQRLFARFSVHAGGASLTQADSVCGPSSELGEDVLDGLASLADKSLVNPQLGADTDPRFVMLSTIRDYAQERLAAGTDYQELARRHAQVYLELVESVADGLTGPDGGRLTDKLELDHDNLRIALDWALERKDLDYSLRFLTAIWRFWQTRGHLVEARKRVTRIMDLPGIADQPADLMARAFEAAGGICYWQGDVRAAHRFYSDALNAARRSGNTQLIARATYNFGFAALDQEQPTDELYAEGEQSFEESLRLFTTLGDEKGIADASWALAIANAAATKDRAVAIGHAEEALTRYRRMGDPFGTGWAAYMVGTLRFPDIGPESVEPYFREALEIFARSRDRSGIGLLLVGFALVADRRGDVERVNRLGGAINRLRAETGAGLLDSPLQFVDFSVPERPSDANGSKQWDEGARLTTEEAISYALGQMSE